MFGWRRPSAKRAQALVQTFGQVAPAKLFRKVDALGRMQLEPNRACQVVRVAGPAEALRRLSQDVGVVGDPGRDDGHPASQVLGDLAGVGYGDLSVLVIGNHDDVAGADQARHLLLRQSAAVIDSGVRELEIRRIMSGEQDSQKYD